VKPHSPWALFVKGRQVVAIASCTPSFASDTPSYF